jgi:predicted ferric reductase
MDIFGFTIPFWAVLLGILVIVMVLWGVIKFAIWVLIFIAIVIIALIGLDFLVGIFHSIGL